MPYTWSTSWINQIFSNYLTSRHYKIVCDNPLELYPLVNIVAQQQLILVLVKVQLVNFGSHKSTHSLSILKKNYQQFQLLSQHYAQFFNATTWRYDFIILEFSHKNLLFRLSHYQQISPAFLCY